MNAGQHVLRGVIRLYQVTLSPLLTLTMGPGSGCRFHPTCSLYARQAIEQHGAWKGALLATRRLCHCHPWGGHGCDPVPPAKAITSIS